MTDGTPAPVTPSQPTPAGGEGHPPANDLAGPQEPTQEPGAPASGDDTAALRREAASWRTKLRETESERDALLARVDAADRGEVERLAGERLRDSEDFWLSGAELADLRDDDGQVDGAKVTAAVAALIAKKPHYAMAPANFDAGVRRGVPLEVSFGEALKAASQGSGQ